MVLFIHQRVRFATATPDSSRTIIVKNYVRLMHRDQMRLVRKSFDHITNTNSDVVQLDKVQRESMAQECTKPLSTST